jgi:hypothetical protein
MNVGTTNPIRPLSNKANSGKPEGGRRMKLNLKAKLLLAAVAVAPIATMPAATATAQQVVRPSQEIVLSIGKGELVQHDRRVCRQRGSRRRPDQVAAPALRLRAFGR